MVIALLAFPDARLGVGSGPGTAAAAGDPVIAAAGDIACDPADSNFNSGNGSTSKQVCLQKQTYNLLTQINPAAVLPLGDNQYYCGGYAAFQQSYALSWGNLLSKTYPVPGNHEYISTTGSGHTDCDTTGQAAGYYKYYANAAMEGATGQGWYSYDVGSWHLIALNSNCTQAGGCGPTSAQGKWLAADLAAHAHQCLLAYWHIPLNTSSVYASTNSYQFWKQLYAAHADVILNGHAHDYERFAPQAPPSTSQTNAGILDGTNGIVEFVVGTGGANHTSLSSTNAPNTVVNNKTAFGVLQLTLHASSYDFKFVPVSGATFTDSGTNVPCHNTGPTAPPAPTLSLTANDTNDYAPAGGSTVFYNPSGTNSGSFTVSATANTANAVQFPTVFGSDSSTDTSSPFTKMYSWTSSATANGSFNVTASNNIGTSSASSFTVTPDKTAPTTSAACNGGVDCSGTYSGSVQVALSASDGSGAGVSKIYYSTDGSTPSTQYNGPFAAPAGATVKFFAVDNVGNAEAAKSVLLDAATGGGTGVALVRNTPASGSTASLNVSVPTSTAGDTLVAMIALAAGNSASVSSVTDSSGGSWTKGPIGFLSGTNSRVEIWYRLSAPAVSSVTITLSTSKAVSANVSEWSGSGWTLDKSAGGSTASGTSASTPAVATTGATDLVIGAINYPAAATSTLSTGSFTGLTDFNSGSGVHGRGAYDVTSSTGSYQASWALSAASGGSGGAILALKASSPPADSTPPTTTIACASGSCSGSFAGPVSVTLNATDSGGSGVQATYYTTDGSDPTVPANRQTYTGAFLVSSTSTVKFYSVDQAGNSENVQSQVVTIDPSTDTTAPTTTITCNDGSCASTFTGAVSVALSAGDDPGGSGVQATYYTTDGSDPTDTTNPSRQTYSGAFMISSTSTIEFYSVDKAGNAENLETQAVTISAASDSTPPTTAILCNGGSCSGTFSSTVTVTLNSSDDSSGVKATYYTTDGSDPTDTANPSRRTYTAAFAVSSSSTVKFYSIDNADNPEGVQSQAITISTGGGSGTQTLTPVADTYAKSATPTSNYGTATAFYVDADGISQSFLKFDLRAVTGTVTSVTLRIYAGSSQSAGYQVFGVADTTWTETGLTWNNKPAFAASSSGSSGPVTSAAWTNVTLPASLVQSALGNFLSLGLSTTSTTNLKLTSREAGAATAPQLIVTTS